MAQRPRFFLLAALVTGFAYGALAVRLFPAERQLLKYPLTARQYLAGQLPPERLLDFSPLYFYLHVLQEWLLPGRWQVVVALQIIAAAGAAWLLGLLLLRFFPVWIAVTGALAFAASRSVLVYAGVLEPEAFLILALIGFLLLAGSPRRGHRVGAGIALAVCLSIRPSALPLMAIVPIYYLVNDGRVRWASPTITVLAPALVVLLALSVRNGIATGDYSPVVMNPGFVFYDGNNPLSSGRSAIYSPVVGELQYVLSDIPDSPHLGYRLVASRASGRELSTAEANRYWRDKALAFVRDEPGRFVTLRARKAYTSFHGYRFHDLIPADRFDRRLSEHGIPSLPIAPLAALGMFGLVVSLRQWRRWLLVYALFASQLAVLMGMYVSERQRLALLPALIFFACAGLAALAGADRRKVAAGVAVCVVLTGIFSIPLIRAREDRHVWEVYELREREWTGAFVLRDAGRLEEAERAAAIAYAAAPWLVDYSRPAGLRFEGGFDERALEVIVADDGDPSRQFDRAQLLLAAGRLDEAEDVLQDLVDRGERFDRGFLSSSEPLHYLGRVSAARGRRDEAVERMTAALAAAPGDPFTLAWLAALTGDEAYRRRIARYFSEVDAALQVGLAQLELGDADAAAASLSEAVRLLPELWRAKMYLAAALGAMGDDERAVRAYLEAAAQRSEPVMLEDEIVPIFARASPNATDSLRYEYGLVLARYGRLSEALVELRAADSAGTRPEVASSIADVERLLRGGASP
jgi:tetratricopeptide (TPR) repeat protein